MNGAVPLSLARSSRPHDTTDVAEHDVPGSGNLLGYALLFVPFGLAAALSPLPLVSYATAWLGSFVILWLTIGGHIRPFPGNTSALDQVMRPLVLTQILFASYNFLSSIFFVMDLHGYVYLTKVSTLPIAPGVLEATAEAQRYYVLAHAAIATGMMAAMNYQRSGEWAVRPLENPARVALVISALALVTGATMGVQNQFGVRIEKIGLVASVLALALAFPTRRMGTLVVALGLYGANLGSAFLSGWKEEVLVMVLLLAVFLYPYARRLVLIGTPVAMIFLLAILPTYANIFRGLNWEGNESAEGAAAVAIEEIQSGEADLGSTNWAFLTGRISEIGLFVKYIDSFDRLDGTQGSSFYGFQIVRQTILSLVPRALWKTKPITEDLVMERVYEAGITTRNSTVSAKPQYVVDGYLSGGAWGVLLAGLAFGLLASWSSRASERWFGGYFWGSGLVFTAMFSVMWKGNTFEFFYNTVLWSFILLVPLFWLGRWTGLLVHSSTVEPDEHEDEEPADRVARRGLSYR